MLLVEKNILEYNKSKKSLVALWQWWLIRGNISIKWFFVYLIPGRIGFWKWWFLRRRENRSTRRKKLSEEGREQTTNLTPIWRRWRDLNPGNIGGRRALTTAPSWPPFFLLISRAPFHTWRKIYENASVCFCPKMPRSNDLCLTPPPPPYTSSWL